MPDATETTEILTAEQKLLAAADRVRRALNAEPHADADAEAELASDLLALAAREVVREVGRAHPDQRPVGWDDAPVAEPPAGGERVTISREDLLMVLAMASDYADAAASESESAEASASDARAYARLTAAAAATEGTS